MGIGAAFASGLVKGFTQNIEKEQARRTAERDRLAEYESMAMKAVLEGDATKSGFNAIQEMVKSGYDQLDSMKPINMFGTRGEDIVMDMSKMQGVLTELSSNYLPGTGSYQITMDDDLYERYTTDRGDTLKEANLWFQTINQHRNKDKASFDAHYKGNNDDLGVLRAEYKQRMQTLVRGRTAAGEEGNKYTFSPTQLANYEEWSNLLGLNSDAENQILFDGLKEATALKFNESYEGSSVDKSAFTVISSHLNNPEANLDSQGEPYPQRPLMGVGTQGEFTTYSLGALEMFGADTGVLTNLAASRGRSLDHWMYDFSTNFNTIADFNEGLMHVTKISQNVTQGKRINFGDTNTVLGIGEYLERELTDDSTLQMSIVNGLMGDVLSQAERREISEGLRTEASFRIGTNREEGFKKVTGVSYNDFKTRLSAASTARQQLELYKDITEDISTVKGTFLDSAVGAVEAFLGDTGTVDQFLAAIGVSNTHENYDSIKSMALARAKGGARAERDTLAFIIAANMARAEDSAGRLSDGDLQRNLQKLTGGYTTKRGEILSVEQVILSIDNQIGSLEDINNAVVAYGSEGMTVPLRRMLRNLEYRDNALKSWTRKNYKPLIGQASMSAADVSGMTESPLFIPSEGENNKLVIDKDGINGAIVGPEGNVVKRGTVQGLLQDGSIMRPASPAQKPSPAPAGPAAQEGADEVFDQSEQDSDISTVPAGTVLGTTGRTGSGTERGLQGVMREEDIASTTKAVQEAGGEVYYDEKTGTYKSGSLPDTDTGGRAAPPAPAPEAPAQSSAPITVDALEAGKATQTPDGNFTLEAYPGKVFKKQEIQSGPNKGGDEYVEIGNS